MYPARIVLSATEGRQVNDAPAHTSAKLQDYIYWAVFTDSRLLEVMKRHDINQSMVAKNPQVAVEGFRDELDVDVYKNEFVQDRIEGAPRSARIAISIRMTDPDKALLVVRELGDLVIQRDADNRKERYTIERKLASNIVTGAETELQRAQRGLYQASSDLEIASPQEAAQLRVEYEGFLKSIDGAQGRLVEADIARKRLDRASALDSQSLALTFDRVDWGVAARKVNEEAAFFINLGVMFFGLLPLVALGVGAMDPRVYDERDVRRAGLVPLGVVRTRDKAQQQRAL
jgi:hypothetical protein